jgi:hypothetical protein
MKAAGMSASALALPPSSDPVSQSTAAGTAASWGATATRSRGGKTLVVVGVGVLVIGVGAFVMRRGNGAAGTSELPSATAAATAPASGLPPTTAPAVSAEPMPPVVAAVATPAPSAAAYPVAPAPSAELAEPPRSVHRHATPKTPAARPAPSPVVTPVATASPTPAPAAPPAAAPGAASAPKKANINTLIDDRR